MDNKDKITLGFVFCIGVIAGMALMLVLLTVSFQNAIEAAGHAFKVENMNLTVSVNQTMLMESIERLNQSRNIP